MSSNLSRSEKHRMLPEQQFAVPVSGPSYRRYTKIFTVSMIISLLAYGIHVFTSRAQAVASPIMWLMLGAWVVLGVTAWYIVTAKTTIDGKGIRQDWFFKKEFRWHEIGRVKFIRLPFSSRLVILGSSGPFRAVNSGCKELDAAFKQLENFYLGRS
jgi:hypothetical protein